MMSDTLITLSEEQVRRYLQLTDRSIFISLHSGASWKPEYAQELEEIDREIATLRPAIDAAIAARHLARGQKPEVVSEDVISDCNDSEDIQSGQEQETVLENVISDCTHSEALIPEQELRYQEPEGIDREIDALQSVISSSGQAGKVPLSNT